MTLYCLLMLSIPLIIYCLIQEWLLQGTILVVVMFAIFMGMLWLSEYEDKNEDARDKNTARIRSTNRY
ncbi:hypothetical protein [Paenibacillus sp. RC67]|uniref:hypothetical protein n=1 Tax=Paenibacillus sp. RC67 TaxID=3039392 RepID=UPI0024ADFEF9|nr:hypothetical protein [Paenibacillus sp. RC67]